MLRFSDSIIMSSESLFEPISFLLQMRTGTDRVYKRLA